MINLSREGHTHDEVYNALMFKSGSRRTSFRYEVLNKDEMKIGELSTASGTVNLNSLAQIKRTASFTISGAELAGMDFLNDRIRPVMELSMPGGGALRYPLGTFLISSPNRQTDGAVSSRSIEAYDKSLILQQDAFTSRHVIPAGSNYMGAAVDIINSAGLDVIDIPNNGALSKNSIEYDIGESKLTAVNDLLSRINYESLTISERGTATARPYQAPAERDIDFHYRDDDMSVMLAEAEEELDIFDIPNVFVRVVSNPETDEVLYASFVNDNPRSSLSTVSRGRNIVDYEELSDFSSADNLQDYVRRIAQDRSQAYNKIRFSTALMPIHGTLNILYLRHRSLNAEGKFTETSWSMDLSAGGRMTHEARRLITI